MFKQTQRSFSGGVLDRELMGRTDLAKYFEGACKLDNFLVRRQGNIAKRRGTLLVADLDNIFGDGSAIENIRSIPFASTSTDIGYTLLLVESSTGAHRCHICSKEGILMVKTVTPSGGGSATITHEWQHYAYIPEGTDGDGNTVEYAPYSVDMPYLGYDFGGIGYFQSGDTLFMAHKSYPFAALTHPDEFSFEYRTIDFETAGNTSLPETPTITSVEKLPEGEWTGTGPEKTIYYIVTAVKDGVESRPSDPYKISYNTPWPENCSIKITIGSQTPTPDYYNIYKKSDSTVGLIGSTSTGLARHKTARVTTLPGSTGLSVKYVGHTTPSTSFDETPAHTDETNDTTSYGFVVENGVYTVTYATAQDIDNINLALGYVWYKQSVYSGGAYHYWIQYLPCPAAKIRAVVTFADNSTQDLGLQSVPAAAQTDDRDNSVTGSPYAASTSEAIGIKRRQMSRGAKVSWSIENRTKKVKSVTFTAYTDNGSTVATGSIANGSSSSWAAITGAPFTISGYWASRNTEETVNELVDEYVTPDVSITPPKYERHFYDEGLFPGCVTMYHQRLALASTLEQPFTYFLSAIGDLYNFNTHDSIREDDAIEATLPATKYPNINHMVLNRDLILFCDNGEWVVQPVSGNTLSYKTLSAKIQSQIGCSKDIVPIVVGNDIIFVNSTNETVHAIRYHYASDGYEDMDLSVLSQNLFRSNPIVSLAYKKNPDSTIVCVLRDGTIAALVYMREHEVVAWSRIILAGKLRAISCSADESVTDGTTNVFIVAAEDMGTYTGYSLLRVREDSPFETVEDAVSMDKMEYISGGATLGTGYKAVNLSTGKVHEAGETLPAGEYLAGYPVTAELITVRPEPSPQETIQFERKNAKSAEIRLLNGSSYRLRSYAAPATIPFTPVKAEPKVTEGAITLDSTDHITGIYGVNSGDGRLHLVHDGVWPLSILQLSVNYEIQPLSGSAG